MCQKLKNEYLKPESLLLVIETEKVIAETGEGGHTTTFGKPINTNQDNPTGPTKSNRSFTWNNDLED